MIKFVDKITEFCFAFFRSAEVQQKFTILYPLPVIGKGLVHILKDFFG
jgi:hypothetical protein